MSERRDQLARALADLEARVLRATLAAHRSRGELTVVAVTKYHPLSDVELLAGLGVGDFGESRQQDLAAKAAARPDVSWHFLGRLQSNKAARVAQVASLVHSYDRAALAGPLGRGAGARADGVRPGVLVQLSLDGDPARGGADPADVLALADAAAAAGLRVAGVMAVAPLGADPGAAFDRLQVASQRLRELHPGATDISAGMSGDLEAAVARGATHLRIGTALLGGRQPPDR